MPHIQRQLLKDGVCVLTFNRADSPANIFDRATLEELEANLQAIAAPEAGVHGLVLISAKPAIFVAGADLHAVQTMSRAGLQEFIELGQRVFTRLAGLPFPTVAAIHGACVGGGYEVALACDWRVASPDKVTKIGLPETKLGILPAWGGSTRLPRLIGLPGALDVILGGKTVAAQSARKRGMIDAIAPREHLLETSRKLLERGKRATSWKRSPWVARFSGPAIARQARAKVAAKTRGHYPAIAKALQVAVAAAGTSSVAEGLRLEREAVLDLAASPTAANLIRIFFQQERAKKLSVPGAPRVKSPESAAVIGAGIMGSGIAQWVSARGLRVILRDVDPARVAAGMANVTRLYEAGVKRHAFTTREARDGIDRIAPTAVEVPLRRTELVIEAAVEKMEVKKNIFRRLDELAAAETILATNTSALSIGELARATKHPARVVGIHFFNPVHQMQLVEVIVAPETSPKVAERALRFVQKIGKLPVLVRDSPGFLVNRILLPYMMEAGELFWHGTDAREIDEAMLDFGMPMGPLRLTDEVGVDVAEDVARTLAAAFPGWMKTPAVLPRMLEHELLGRKSGAGFYLYAPKKEATENPAARRLRPNGGHRVGHDEVQQRMTLLMVNEAARCVEEKLVEQPADVDFAMVMGTGFAPFRGGPLRYADALGAARVVAALNALAERAGAHFRPCSFLTEMAAQQRKFYED